MQIKKNGRIIHEENSGIVVISAGFMSESCDQGLGKAGTMAETSGSFIRG